MGTKLSDLTAATSIALTDIVHLRTTGGVDKKITKDNLFLDIIKKYMAIQLTEYTTTTVPQIAGSGACEINGVIYTNTSAITITGSTSNSTWYDILLTPSGSSYTASFIARGTGVWSDSKQGLYSGNNRVVACVYRDGSGNFIRKNTIVVIDRSVLLNFEIGDWNMQSTTTLNIAHGLAIDDIVGTGKVLIKYDTGTQIIPLTISLLTGSNLSGDGDISFSSTNLILERRSTGIFDSANFNATSFNRGWAPIKYRV